MNTKVQTPRRWVGCLFMLVAAAVGGAAVLIIFWPALGLVLLSVNDHREMSEVTVRDLAEEAALDLPADARITHFEETPPIDPVWVARVAMSEAATPQLIRSVEAHRAEDVHVTGALSESKAWWKPSNVILSRMYTPPRGALVMVVVSQEAGQTIVYIERMSN